MTRLLGELTLDEIRERIGREPTGREWLMLVKAAAAERDFVSSMEELRRLAESDAPSVDPGEFE